jgi:hypothetical protein
VPDAEMETVLSIVSLSSLLPSLSKSPGMGADVTDMMPEMVTVGGADIVTGPLPETGMLGTDIAIRKTVVVYVDFEVYCSGASECSG